MSKYTICLDIGGSKILGALMDENNNIVCRVKKKTKPEAGVEAVDERIKSVIEELFETSGVAREEVKAIGAGAPGVIDTDRGVVLYAPNLPWREHQLGFNISNAFGIPFIVGNDVNVGTLGEWKYGAAKGFSHVLGLFVGTGLGGGIVIDDKLFTGSLFAGAEVGHMTLNPDGPLCNCGQRGCLEAYASKIALTKEIQAGLARKVPSVLAETYNEKDGVIKSSVLKKAVAVKDKLALDALDRAMYYLAAGTGNLINILNPQVVVFGGGVVEALEDEVMALVGKYIDRFAWPAMLSNAVIRPSLLKDDAILYGARALIAQKLGELS